MNTIKSTLTGLSLIVAVCLLGILGSNIGDREPPARVVPMSAFTKRTEVISVVKDEEYAFYYAHNEKKEPIIFRLVERDYKNPVSVITDFILLPGAQIAVERHWIKSEDVPNLVQCKPVELKPLNDFVINTFKPNEGSDADVERKHMLKILAGTVLYNDAKPVE